MRLAVINLLQRLLERIQIQLNTKLILLLYCMAIYKSSVNSSFPQEVRARSRHKGFAPISKVTITNPSSQRPSTAILKTLTNQPILPKTLLLHLFRARNGICLQCARPSRRLGHPPRPQPRPRRFKKRSPHRRPFLSSSTQTSRSGKR